MGNAQIERRKTDFAAELAAVQDLAADRVRLAEQVLSPAEIAGRERGAHRRTRDALLAFDDVGICSSSKAPRAA